MEELVCRGERRGACWGRLNGTMEPKRGDGPARGARRVLCTHPVISQLAMMSSQSDAFVRYSFIFFRLGSSFAGIDAAYAEKRVLKT